MGPGSPLLGPPQHPALAVCITLPYTVLLSGSLTSHVLSAQQPEQKLYHHVPLTGGTQGRPVVLGHRVYAHCPSLVIKSVFHFQKYPDLDNKLNVHFKTSSLPTTL